MMISLDCEERKKQLEAASDSSIESSKKLEILE